MKYDLFSYRFAREILSGDPAYAALRDEILDVVRRTPLPIFSGKSAKNQRLDVVQQIINTHYDYEFSVLRDWQYHPSATAILDSELKADFKKLAHSTADNQRLAVQVEAQFGNMARWYTDVFKFQTSYSQNQIDLGVCVVPKFVLAKRIDSNITHYERVCRELPSAKVSITLPILVIGLEPDDGTISYDLTQCRVPPLTSNNRSAIGAFTAKGATENRYRAVSAMRDGTPPSELTLDSPVGPMAGAAGPSLTVVPDDSDET